MRLILVLPFLLGLGQVLPTTPAPALSDREQLQREVVYLQRTLNRVQDERDHWRKQYDDLLADLAMQALLRDVERAHPGYTLDDHGQLVPKTAATPSPGVSDTPKPPPSP